MFGAGCFWGVELSFSALKGVTRTVVGYAGGTTENPTYQEICGGETYHAEVVLCEYDALVVRYENLLALFFESHDPTTLNRQGADVGSQYRSVIFYFDEAQHAAASHARMRLVASSQYADEIVTQIEPAPSFFAAEEYHQQYLSKRGQKSCRLL